MECKTFHLWKSEKYETMNDALDPGKVRNFAVYRLADGTEVCPSVVSNTPEESGLAWNDVKYLGEGYYVRTMKLESSKSLADLV